MVNRHSRSSTSFLRFTLLILLSAGVMIADARSGYLHVVRSGLATIITPVQYLATVPQGFAERLMTWFASGEKLREDHALLESQHAKLRAKLQRLSALEKENANLRRLLSAAQKVPDRVLMAELIEVSLEPFTQRILVDRGLTDGTHVGQPVLDPEGVMGQITQAMPFTSAVTLITDPSHAIPIQIKRNGVRAVAFGVGDAHSLKISYLTTNADVKVGDLLLTSGLGGRFPAGYPVAKVKSVQNDPGEAFLRISAEPIAQLDRANQALLVWRGLSKEGDDPTPEEDQL